MPQISLMVHTASSDEFLRVHGIDGYFDALTHCLQRQTFQNFELVYIDTFHEANAERFAAIAARRSFPIKHVPVHPEHRYWFDKNHCFIAAAKNTGILYADGELVVSIDDAEFPPDDLLAVYWERYQAGHCLHALHKRMTSIVVDNGRPTYPIQGDVYVNDHRWGRLTSDEPLVHGYGSWLFAGTSFALADALEINGYNERLDGCKSLDDCDFGTRLNLLGRTFSLDRRGFVYIVDHPRYGEEATFGPDGQQIELGRVVRRNITDFIAVENYGTLMAAVELRDPVANRGELTPAQIEIIKRETIKFRGFDPTAPERAADFELWRGTPTFDLRRQREALRTSPDWKWP